MIWFYADDRDQQHEAEDSQLADLVSSGSIRPDTLVWNETMTDWEKAESVRPDLFDQASGPPELTASQKKQVVAAGASATGIAPTPIATDPTAVCALIFGVLGLLCIPIFSPVAVICGHIGLKRANNAGRSTPNKGLSIAGIATGYLGILVLILYLVFFGISIITEANSSGSSSF